MAGFRSGPSRAMRSTRPVRAKGMATKTAHTGLSLVGRTQTDGGDCPASKFRELAEELQVLLELGNLSLIRDRLAESVGWLRSCADSIEHDEAASAEEMQSELRAVQGRLHEAESLAASDCLTGLANRREAEKLMVHRIQAGRPFCILLFDLDNFKQVNDWHGHDVGDHLLKAFSNRLASQFRPDDVVCRWGGDEFLVVISCTMPDALGKASLVAERLSGQYAMESASGAVNICVSATVGVAQHEPGESGQELFARADALLYQHKAESRSSGGPRHAHRRRRCGRIHNSNCGRRSRDSHVGRGGSAKPRLQCAASRRRRRSSRAGRAASRADPPAVDGSVDAALGWSGTAP